jgi:hemoglobin
MASQAHITPFDAMGGHPTLERIANHFYDLMDSEPDYRELRALHAANLTPMRASLASFLAGWAGGPRDWFDQNPGKCMMSVHKHIPISSEVAYQWADAMRRAIETSELENKKLAEALTEVLTNLAMSMAQS